MNKWIPLRMQSMGLILLLAILACNLPGSQLATQPAPAPTTSGAPPDSLPVQPAASGEAPISLTHLLTPPNVPLVGTIAYDSESQTTAAQHRAPYWDVYDYNRLERPFTANEMNYNPNLDIVRFRISADKDWYYVFIELIGKDPNDPISIDYGVEIDRDHDGFGEALIWAKPPYGTDWSTGGVMVYEDSNHDSAGTSAIKSDAPFAGDGYDRLLFDSGKGGDPDLAWVRLHPSDSSVIEFAFKQSLAGKSFMWGTWADAGPRDPSKFSYNDRFTLAEAGSPLKDNLYYPLKALYQTDSTCRKAYGFKATDYEPLICPPNVQPSPTKAPPDKEHCIVDPACVGPYFTWVQSSCSCEEIIIQ
jgi:hypothetical protein